MFDLNRLYNADCMDGMREFPDRFFDLAIVDVPYGINAGDYKRGGTQARHAAAASTVYTRKDWDKEPPPAVYFSELRRISKNQIIWGANHFISRLPLDSPCWIVWDKQNGDNGYADCELAWTSFKSAVRQFSFKWQGMLQGDMKNKESRVHPTQKPVALYRWLLQRYATPDNKIIDTHAGSASSLIACWEMGLDFIGFEIDTEYYTSANERLQSVTAQVRFDIPQFAGGGIH
ncbi:methyltransferase [Clostridia bacterium]|nr:methyltransferase [Clostridia bacterium]GHV32696.1 methyltransferase [Clostridia bacterium]